MDTLGSTVLCSPSVPVGEMPPPPPRACFGRDEIIEKIIGLAENLTPIALIGAGGIGKTSIALAVLHHDRIKQRFGDNRRFIRCDQFPASRPNFLNRLSKAIGAGVDNPEDLVPLRSSLSSTKMFIVLDNAESIFDPRGTNGHEIYSLVEELCQFDNICLTITSRITTVPPDCKHLNVPTLSMDAARSTFYRIYGSRERTDIIDNIIVQLDFHPLSVTLLATVAHQSMWDHCELAREWQRRQTGVLHTEHSKSLAAAIELSLASPTFLELGSNARDLLGVIAFVPQGVNRNKFDWLFPTIPDRTNLFDKFCILSLTYRNNGYITMLAPLRDYLRPKDPNSSPLLRATKERYFTRISAVIDPNNQVTFGETRWITLEDENVEHLLDVLTSLDMVPEDIWDACANFLRYLCWHKKRQTVLRLKIEGLPDNHPSKPTCLFGLARLFHSVGNHTEQKRLLTHVLRLRREREDDYQVAHTLESLSNANRLLGLREEGIQQAREALKIFEQLGNMAGQAGCLITLAWLLYEVGQLDAAETAASYAIILLPEKSEQFLVCRSHRILGDIYYSKAEREKAINNFDVAVGIASVFNWHNELFWIHYSLALLFFNEDGFDDAHIHIKQAISHGINHANYLGYAALLQAAIWYRQHDLEEATSAALRAYDIFDKSGATNCRVACTNLLEDIERAMKSRPTTGESNSNGERLSFWEQSTSY